jgi:putative copper export protein
MEFRKLDIFALILIWVGVLVAAVVVGVLVADDDPKTDDGAAMAQFALVAGGLLSGLYILVRERRDQARKKLVVSRREPAVAHEQAVDHTSSPRLRNAGQLALAAGLWAVGTVVVASVIGYGSVAVWVGGLLPVGVLLVLNRRGSRSQK